MAGTGSQDWEAVVLRRGRPAVSAAVAARPGVASAGGGRIVSKVSGEVSHAGKLDREELPKLRTLSPATRRAITDARVAKGQTQAALNMAASLPANAVRDYEAGRATPSSTDLQKLSRALGISLHLAK